MVSLDEAIERANLPALIASYFPESGVVEKPGLYRAAWRGDKKASLSLYRYKGIWFFHDHATGDKGTAWHFLTKIVGLSKREALAILGVGGEAKSQAELLSKAQAALKAKGLPEELARRGFTFEEALRLGFGLLQNNLAIPIFGPSGELLAVKLRRNSEPKYCYLQKHSKAASWHSANFASGAPVVVVEGELNAMLASCIAPELSFIGVAGAENSPQWSCLIGRKVYLAADDDAAGQRALARWQQEAESYGIFPLALKPLPQDFCDMGRQRLKRYLAKLQLARYCERIVRRRELDKLEQLKPIAAQKLFLSNQDGGIYRLMLWSRDIGW